MGFAAHQSEDRLIIQLSGEDAFHIDRRDGGSPVDRTAFDLAPDPGAGDHRAGYQNHHDDQEKLLQQAQSPEGLCGMGYAEDLIAVVHDRAMVARKIGCGIRPKSYQIRALGPIQFETLAASPGVVDRNNGA